MPIDCFVLGSYRSRMDFFQKSSGINLSSRNVKFVSSQFPIFFSSFPYAEESSSGIPKWHALFERTNSKISNGENGCNRACVSKVLDSMLNCRLSKLLRLAQRSNLMLNEKVLFNSYSVRCSPTKTKCSIQKNGCKNDCHSKWSQLTECAEEKKTIPQIQK